MQVMRHINSLITTKLTDGSRTEASRSETGKPQPVTGQEGSVSSAGAPAGPQAASQAIATRSSLHPKFLAELIGISTREQESQISLIRQHDHADGVITKSQRKGLSSVIAANYGEDLAKSTVLFDMLERRGWGYTRALD